MTKITIDRSVVEQALDALEGVVHAHGYKGGTPVEAITALRQALEQPRPAPPELEAAVNDALGLTAQLEPVATLWQHGETGRTRITTPDEITDCDARWFKAADLYTHQPVIDKSAAVRIATVLGWEPKREWVGLTEEEIIAAMMPVEEQGQGYFLRLARAIEAKLKGKNT